MYFIVFIMEKELFIISFIIVNICIFDIKDYIMRLFLLFLFFSFIGQSQIILLGPYLQDANPNSIHVMWETSLGQESLVEYGLTASLGSSASGSSALSFGVFQVHDTKIDGLLPNTRYYYRVKTQAAISPIYDFVTPPNPSSEKSFNIVAMSDMQQDSQHPNVLVTLSINN